MFWTVTVVMALLAISFVATPLVKNDRRLGLVSVAVALPIFSAGLYWLVGSPQAASAEAPAHRSIQKSPKVTSSTGGSVGSVASMVDGLATRLGKDPDDGKSWLLLARSYKHLNRMPEALGAYENAVALGEYDEELALTSASLAPTDSAAAQVFGRLKLSEDSKDIVLPTDTVFIFARAVGGPPMPIAVLRRSVSDLPLEFLLNDSQAMSPDAKLSDFTKVIVTARISRSGLVTDALQGLEARSDEIVVTENRHLNLILE